MACRALSKNNENPTGASRPWDKNRDGFVMGEGAGVLVLEELEHAQARGANIICEYLGGAITCDAHHVTNPRPDGLGVASSIEMAIEDAGIERDQVNYINAHATSTDLGDVAEVYSVYCCRPACVSAPFVGCLCSFLFAWMYDSLPVLGSIPRQGDKSLYFENPTGGFLSLVKVFYATLAHQLCKVHPLSICAANPHVQTTPGVVSVFFCMLDLAVRFIFWHKGISHSMLCGA